MDPRTIFSSLRQALADLYPDEPSARRMVDDVGLGRATIAFHPRAIDTWHSILTEVVKLEKMDELLAAVTKEYGSNRDFRVIYQDYHAFVAEGGRFTAPTDPSAATGGIHAGGDVIVATVGDSAQQVVIGKEIHIEHGGLPAPSARAEEIAYLEALVAQYEYWEETYTPLAGMAEVRAAGRRLNRPQRFMQTGFEKLVDHFGRVERVPVDDDIRTAVNQYKRLVLLGEPGSGKTTTLWRLVYDYAQAALTDDAAPLPVLVPLGGYTGAETPLQYCQAHCGQLGDRLITYLRSQRVILLLDALNEMPRQEYRARVQRIQQFLADYAAVPVVVTCRALDYVETLALEKLDIKPLDLERQRAYLHHYLDEQYGEKLFWQLAGGDVVADLWQSWTAADGTWAQFWYAEEVPEHLKWRLTWPERDLWEALRAQLPPLLELGRNPFMLVMLAQVYAAQGTIPQNRGRLFAAFVETLLAREEKRCGPARWPGAEPLRTALAQLAYVMQEAGERGTAVAETWAGQQIEGASSARSDLLYLAASATLLELRDGKVRFVHQLLQEYFAARALQSKWQAGADLSAFWPQGWIELTGWEETFVLLAGLVPDMTPLISDLLSANPVRAARCIADSGGQPPAAHVLKQVQTTLVSLVMSEEASIKQRNAAGDALTAVDDPRSGVGLTADGLPDLVWYPVPAGAFLMGNTKQTDTMAFGDEAPQHELRLPAFAISKYPITNAHYTTFVHDGGYTDKWRHCWTAAGWQWRSDKNISGPEQYGGAYNLPNHPVVGVAWYEAMAFCQWLSAKLGRSVMLPSEAQWEKAACGPDGRRYPWGPDLTPEHANYRETGIGTTSSVGIFPKGQSPYQALDMAGNVWEWTSSLFKEYPYKADDGREDPAAAGRRVVRGGSFDDYDVLVRCAYRNFDDPDDRSISCGFRVLSPGS